MLGLHLQVSTGLRSFIPQTPALARLISLLWPKHPASVGVCIHQINRHSKIACEHKIKARLDEPPE
jgi:hypothetical protein